MRAMRIRPSERAPQGDTLRMVRVGPFRDEIKADGQALRPGPKSETGPAEASPAGGPDHDRFGPCQPEA